MMKTIKRLSWLVCLFILFIGCSKTNVKAAIPEKVSEKPKDFRVVGYVFAWADMTSLAAGIDFTKLSQLNIAFINPDEAGVFPEAKGLSDLVKKAHDSGVKVIAAFGGGSAPAHLKALIKPDKRKAMVDGLTQLTKIYNLDGIDVDLEGDFVNSDYEAFVVELSSALKKEGKLMTTAVATWNSAAYTDKAIKLFDFINIMSYDQSGPWRKDSPGPHSTYQAAVEDFKHWHVTRGIPANQLILGLPFYGYGFGPNIVEGINYGDLVSQYPGAEKVDIWVIPDKGTFYYNGVATIKRKVNMALDKKMGGVMIWQIFGDASAPNSLLTAINDTIKQ